MNKQHKMPELIRLLSDRGVTKVKLAITDIDGVLRGKMISFEKFRSVAESGFGFCDVVFGWDSADLAYDNAAVTGWHSGYPDAQALVDLDTFRNIPWEADCPFFLADFSTAANGVRAACPRTLLKQVLDKAGQWGYTVICSQEFEWFNFKNNRDELYATGFRALQPATPGMFGYSLLRASENSAYFQDLFDLLEKFGVPIEGIHTETGPGVYEAAIRYAGMLEAADRAVLFKSGVKEIALRHGLLASFMAKFNDQLPGCSGHVHQSLWDAGERNLFYDQGRERGMSVLMEQYIAGQLYCLPQILPLFAPTVNSYKRLVEGAWAPTTVTWGIDNRTTALRALPGSASSTRLETRVVGSDANPYLAMAACLASGLYGIEHKLELTLPPCVGNGYQQTKNGVLPKNLSEATRVMKESALAAELFGEAFVAHFVQTREWEWRQFSRAVTDWELKRYFEII